MSTTNATTPNHQRRTRIVGLALALAVATVVSTVAAAPAGATRFTGRLTTSQSNAKNALNHDRKLQGRRVLVSEADAQAKAQAWANRLANEGRIYHSRLNDGFRRPPCAVGENVGYGRSVGAVEAAYMRSTVHRNNILDNRWNGVGVGVAVRGNVVYTVQVFVKTC